MTTRRGMPLGWLLLPAAVVAVAGCGSAGADDAGRTAAEFESAAQADKRVACRLLAPQTQEKVAQEGEGDCAKGLESLAADLPSAGAGSADGSDTEAEVAGESAVVHVSGDTVFLARFADGWRVTAAGCQAPADDPEGTYDCAVSGG